MRNRNPIADSATVRTAAGVPPSHAPPPLPPPWPPPYLPYPPMYPVPFPYAYPPVVRMPPRPRGPPKRSWFVVGAVGQFFAAGAALALEVAMALDFELFLGGNVLAAIMAAILFAALVVQMAGFYGLRWNYGMALGTAAIVVDLVAFAVFLAAVVLTPFAYEEVCDWGWCFRTIAPWGIVLNIVAFVLLGAAFIVQGAVCLVARRFTGLPGAAIAAAVLFIVGGSLLCSVLLTFLGGLLVLVPAFIIYGIVLLYAPLPPYDWRPAATYPAGAP